MTYQLQVNPCITTLKQKTLRYQFITKYNTGKWNRGADVCSQNLIAQHMICSICTEPNSNDISESEKIEELTAITVQTTIIKLYKNEQILAFHTEPKDMITFETVQNACHNDPPYQ